MFHFAKNRNAVRSPCVITGQRHCYNLCESRVGSAALIAALRGYAFSVGLSVPRREVGGHRACRLDKPTIAAQEAARMGDEGNAVGVP